MGSIVKIKLAGGGAKYQASVQNKRRGLPRVKRTFATRKAAREWIAAVEEDNHNRLLGRQRQHLFGEALAKYLRELSPKKKSHQDDVYNARALRWPVWSPDSRRWLRLELEPLDAIPAGMSVWTYDMRQVQKRVYIGGEGVYQLRRTDGGAAWWYQRDGEGDEPPPPRERVTDSQLIARLEATGGRGPFSASTLRVRQSLVKTVLSAAWRVWNCAGDRWLDADIADRIESEQPPKARVEYLLEDQLLSLLIGADVGFDHAILGAAWIGWRKGNVVGSRYKAKGREIQGLTWDRVVWPERDPHGRTVRAGYIISSDTKNGDDVVQPMSDRVEQLLRLRWELRNGPLVFHRGDGEPWLNFKRRWSTLKRRQNIDIRWHGLRHSWATEMARAGVRDGQLQELGGWRDRKTVAIYTHVHREDLLDAVNLHRRNAK